jgi:hypothetical protein
MVLQAQRLDLYTNHKRHDVHRLWLAIHVNDWLAGCHQKALVVALVGDHVISKNLVLLRPCSDDTNR